MDSKKKKSLSTDLLNPAKTKNCPCGLQKMLFACCLSNISETIHLWVNIYIMHISKNYLSREMCLQHEHSLIKSILPLFFTW